MRWVAPSASMPSNRSWSHRSASLGCRNDDSRRPGERDLGGPGRGDRSRAGPLHHRARPGLRGRARCRRCGTCRVHHHHTCLPAGRVPDPDDRVSPPGCPGRRPRRGRAREAAAVASRHDDRRRPPEARLGDVMTRPEQVGDAPGELAMPHLTPELLARHDRPGPRYTSYPTALEFTSEYGPDAHRARLDELATTRDPLALYVHLPFCESRCSFCACHVVVTSNESLASRYLDAVAVEIDTVAKILGDGHRFA